MAWQGRHHVMPGMTSCHARGDMIIMSSGQLWLVLADLAVLAKAWHSADRCCAYWWTGLMLSAVACPLNLYTVYTRYLGPMPV